MLTHSVADMSSPTMRRPMQTLFFLECRLASGFDGGAQPFDNKPVNV
jgi:hypothetical protein